MASLRSLLTGLAVAAAITVAPGIRAQSPAPDAAAIVERAGRYVEAYIEAFSAVVSEEHQIQKLVRADGRVRKTRELTSDFLLVKTGTSPWPVVFRDVIAADGKPVPDRSDRLRKLLLEQPKAAVELAKAVSRESERLNIGLQRTGNSPLVPLVFLTPRVASGVRFEAAGSRLTFQEFRSPSVMGSRRGQNDRRDIMANGSFEIDPDSGSVLAAELTGDPSDYVTMSFRVRYQKDPRLNLSVPVDVSERYWQPGKPDEDRLEVESTYSGFRRFAVTTGEQIKIPK